MKRILLALALLPLLAMPAAAEKTQTIGGEKAALVVDDETGTIRFLINGEEKAFLDESGLHVRESINYGRNLTDYGPSGFDESVKERSKEAGLNE